MKQTLTVVLLTLPLGILAQTAPTTSTLYREGLACLQGVTTAYDPVKAKAKLLQAAALGEGQAMNVLGNLYRTGEGTPARLDSTLYWYQAAAQKGCHEAWYHLGTLYKEGQLAPQDFAKAAGYFAKGSALQQDGCTYMLAYLYYKGFGVPQHYQKAYEGFKRLAQKGAAPAYYFLALCYRNGYGTTADKEQAQYWLQKAATTGDKQAKQELREALPENVSTVSPHLQQQLAKLSHYQEKFAPAAHNNYEGIYTGHIVYYDWSRQFVSDIQPLRLTLTQTGNGYKGEWQEGDGVATAITLANKTGQLVFDSNCHYQRNNHYSGRQPEQWQFNRAQLNMGFWGDSVWLTGAVQFYSEGRREPGKPVQLILKKAMTPMGGHQKLNIKLLPNPATNHTALQFTLTATAHIMVKVLAQDGNILFVETEKQLPAGTYTYVLPIGLYRAGTYQVQVLVNGKAAATETLVKL